MRVTSFGKSLIECHTKQNASTAFAKRVIAAAKKRFPDLVLKRIRNNAIVYESPSNQSCAAILIDFKK